MTFAAPPDPPYQFGMADLAAVARALTSPDQFLGMWDEPRVFGAQRQARAAYALWSGADERFVGAYRGIHAPGGTGTGFIIRVFWDPARSAADLEAIEAAINSHLPIDLIRADEKATWKGRDTKQGVFFTWRGVRSRPLSRWFEERFGVYACTSQLLAKSDLTQNVAVVAVKDGVDHVWTLTA